MTRIVFMGTPEFAVPTLQKLIEVAEVVGVDARVVGVVTQPDRPAGRGQQLRPSPVKTAALAAGLPIYQPQSLRKPETAVPLRNWQPDLIVVAAYGQILRRHILDMPPLGCLNVHASLLPRWRGASPIQHAILSGDPETGISLMRMDKGLDTGPVFVQKAIPIDERETAATLHDRLAHLGAELLGDCLDDIINGRLPAAPQDDERSTYAPMIGKEDGRLDWSHSSIELDRRVRAMTPWPGAFTFWNGARLKVLAARPAQGVRAAPGTVMGDAAAGTAVVAAGQGGLQLDRLQLAGKRPADIADFLNGRPDLIGSVLR